MKQIGAVFQFMKVKLLLQKLSFIESFMRASTMKLEFYERFHKIFQQNFARGRPALELLAQLQNLNKKS